MESMDFISVLYIPSENYIGALCHRGCDKHTRIKWLRFKNLGLI